MADKRQTSFWHKVLSGVFGSYLNTQIKSEIENNPDLYKRLAEQNRQPIASRTPARFNVYHPINLHLRQAYFRFNRYLQARIGWDMYGTNPEAGAIINQIGQLSTYRLADDERILWVKIKNKQDGAVEEELSEEITDLLHDIGFAQTLGDTNKKMLIEGSHFQEVVWAGRELVDIQIIDGAQEGMITEKVWLKKLGWIWATYDNESSRCVAVRLPEDVLHFRSNTMYLDPESKTLYGMPHLMQGAKGHEYYVNALKKMAEIRAASEYERHHGFPDNAFTSKEEFERFIQWVEEEGNPMNRLKNGFDVITTGSTRLVESQLEGLNAQKNLDLAAIDQGLTDLGGVADGILPGRGKNVNRETLTLMLDLLDKGLLTDVNNADTHAIKNAVRTWLVMAHGLDSSQYRITCEYGSRKVVTLAEQFTRDWQMLQGGRLDPDDFDSRWGTVILSQNPDALRRIDDMFAQQQARETVNVYDAYADRVNQELQ